MCVCPVTWPPLVSFVASVCLWPQLIVAAVVAVVVGVVVV